MGRKLGAQDLRRLGALSRVAASFGRRAAAALLRAVTAAAQAARAGRRCESAARMRRALICMRATRAQGWRAREAHALIYKILETPILKFVASGKSESME